MKKIICLILTLALLLALNACNTQKDQQQETEKEATTEKETLSQEEIRDNIKHYFNKDIVETKKEIEKSIVQITCYNGNSKQFTSIGVIVSVQLKISGPPKIIVICHFESLFDDNGNVAGKIYIKDKSNNSYKAKIERNSSNIQLAILTYEASPLPIEPIKQSSSTKLPNINEPLICINSEGTYGLTFCEAMNQDGFCITEQYDDSTKNITGILIDYGNTLAGICHKRSSYCVPYETIRQYIDEYESQQ